MVVAGFEEEVNFSKLSFECSEKGNQKYVYRMAVNGGRLMDNSLKNIFFET